MRSRFSVCGTVWSVGIRRLGILPDRTVRYRTVPYRTVRYGGPRYTASCAATCHELAFRAFLTSRFACTRRTRVLDYTGRYRTMGSGCTVLQFLVFNCPRAVLVITVPWDPGVQYCISCSNVGQTGHV